MTGEILKAPCNLAQPAHLRERKVRKKMYINAPVIFFLFFWDRKYDQIINQHGSFITPFHHHTQRRAVNFLTLSIVWRLWWWWWWSSGGGDDCSNTFFPTCLTLTLVIRLLIRNLWKLSVILQWSRSLPGQVVLGEWETCCVVRSE